MGGDWWRTEGNARKKHGLRVSKIADGVYFGTWVTANRGEDSVVWDLQGMAVSAHLRWSDVFRQLVGEFKVDSATTLNYRPQ